MAYIIPDNIRSRNEVPAGIKRVAEALVCGLDDAVTVWYEPPYAPDGDAPHFVILLPDRGIITLEVLDIKASGVLGVFRGRVRIEREDQEIEVEDPLERARKRAEGLRQVVAAEPRLKDQRVPVEAGAAFPNLERAEAEAKKLDRQIDLDRCLFKGDITKAIQDAGGSFLVRLMNRILGSQILEQSLTEDTEKVLRGLIQPDIVIDRKTDGSNSQLMIFRAPTESSEKDIIRVMDRKQEALAKGLGGGHRVIRGVAGSGKTLILVFRARMLARAHPKHRILVTCYTKTLAGELRMLLGAEPNIDVHHLDGLMAKVLHEARVQHPGYADDRTGDTVAKLAKESLPKFSRRYVAVLIDEAQDFSTAALQFAGHLLEEGSDEFLIVADAAQNIFRRKFSWSQAGIQARGRTKILRTNYRNTREILEFASSFLLSSSVLHTEDVPDFEDENAIIPPESSIRQGPSPITLRVRDTAHEVESTVARVKELVNGGVPSRAIAILYASEKSGESQVIEPIVSALAASGINAFAVRSRKDKDMLAHSQAPVIVCTIYSAKGLEFPHVILCNPWKDDEELETNRKLAYVGMTRAVNTLTVIARDDHPLTKDLPQL